MSPLIRLFQLLKTPLNKEQIQKIFDFYLFRKKSFVAFIIFTSFSFFLIKVYPEMSIAKIDDPSYYVAAIGISNSINIYDLASFISLGESILGKSTNVLPYVYPPLLAEVFTVFSHLNYQTYTQILFVFNLFLSLLLLISIYLLFHSGKNEFYLPTILFFLILNINTPLMRTINNGQINLLILNLLILTFFFYRINKYFLSSFFLGLACLIKIFPILFLLIIFIQKKIKYFIFFIAHSLFLIFISILFYGQQVWIDYVVHFAQNFMGSKKTIFSLLYSSAISNNSLRAFCHQLSQFYNLPSDLSSLISILLSIIILTATCLILIKYRTSFDFSFSLLIVTYIFISPLSWVHHYVIVIVPLYYLVLKILDTQTYYIFFLFLPVAAIIISFPVIAGFPFNQFRLFAMIVIYFLLIFSEKLSSPSCQPPYLLQK